MALAMALAMAAVQDLALAWANAIDETKEKFMKSKNLQVLKKNRRVIQSSTAFCNNTQGGMRAHDATGNKYEITAYNDKINSGDCYFDIETISFELLF